VTIWSASAHQPTSHSWRQPLALEGNSHSRLLMRALRDAGGAETSEPFVSLHFRCCWLVLIGISFWRHCAALPAAGSTHLFVATAFGTSDWLLRAGQPAAKAITQVIGYLLIETAPMFFGQSLARNAFVSSWGCFLTCWLASSYGHRDPANTTTSSITSTWISSHAQGLT